MNDRHVSRNKWKYSSDLCCHDKANESYTFEKNFFSIFKEHRWLFWTPENKENADCIQHQMVFSFLFETTNFPAIYFEEENQNLQIICIVFFKIHLLVLLYYFRLKFEKICSSKKWLTLKSSIWYSIFYLKCTSNFSSMHLNITR